MQCIVVGNSRDEAEHFIRRVGVDRTKWKGVSPLGMLAGFRADMIIILPLDPARYYNRGDVFSDWFHTALMTKRSQGALVFGGFRPEMIYHNEETEIEKMLDLVRPKA